MAGNEKETQKKGWVDKMDQTSLGDLRKKFPTAFWVVGGIVLVALVF